MVAARQSAIGVLALTLGAACTKAPPRVPTVSVTLEVPAPPARTFIPVVLSEPVEAPPVDPEPAAAATAGARTRPPATRPPDRTTPPPSPAPVAEPPANAPVLQTTANVTALQERIRTTLAGAQQDLDRVRPQDLTVSARAQYEQARGFIRMANEALKIRNLLYAEQLARKAAAVAAQLAKS